MDDDDATCSSDEEQAENGSEDGSWTTASDDGNELDSNLDVAPEESLDNEAASSPIAPDQNQLDAHLNEPDEVPNSGKFSFLRPKKKFSRGVLDNAQFFVIRFSATSVENFDLLHNCISFIFKYFCQVFFSEK